MMTSQRSETFLTKISFPVTASVVLMWKWIFFIVSQYDEAAHLHGHHMNISTEPRETRWQWTHRRTAQPKSTKNLERVLFWSHHGNTVRRCLPVRVTWVNGEFLFADGALAALRLCGRGWWWSQIQMIMWWMFGLWQVQSQVRTEAGRTDGQHVVDVERLGLALNDTQFLLHYSVWRMIWLKV